MRYIYIELIGHLHEINFDAVVEDMGDNFEFPVKIVKSTFDVAGTYDPNRRQYYSTKILKEMISHIPSDALKVIGLTPFDLFIPILTFVFGEAQLKGMVGIVSIARLRQEFYGLPSNAELVHRRLIKEINHELGHIFGLIHCQMRDCVMYLANTIRDVDIKGEDFCIKCREILESRQKEAE